MWDEALHLVVEFDGWKTHGPDAWRGRTKDDRIKTRRLTDMGETVIRVREDLDPSGHTTTSSARGGARGR
jgi:very-short-patch-repair endonuclease